MIAFVWELLHIVAGFLPGAIRDFDTAWQVDFVDSCQGPAVSKDLILHELGAKAVLGSQVFNVICVVVKQ